MGPFYATPSGGQTQTTTTSNIMQNIIEALVSKKGQFASVTWVRPVAVKKSAPEWAQHITKRCEAKNGANARAGINYDNLQSVKDKRASGELPAENAGLPEWQEWEVFPYLLRHKTKGTRYVRLYPTDAVKVTYLVEGEEIPYAKVEEFLLASEKPTGVKPDCISLTLDYVTSLV